MFRPYFLTLDKVRYCEMEEGRDSGHVRCEVLRRVYASLE